MGDITGVVVVLMIFGILSFLPVIYGLTMPKLEIILDRLNGLITVPGGLWNKPVTLPFNKAKATIGAAGWPPSLTLAVVPPSKKGHAILAQYDQIQTWNFYVWYMDKNRPLPPGTAFDPYRQKDYERRKAEGFPPPLYHSVIPTPEWVPGKGKSGSASVLNNLN